MKRKGIYFVIVVVLVVIAAGGILGKQKGKYEFRTGRLSEVEREEISEADYKKILNEKIVSEEDKAYFYKEVDGASAGPLTTYSVKKNYNDWFTVRATIITKTVAGTETPVLGWIEKTEDSSGMVEIIPTTCFEIDRKIGGNFSYSILLPAEEKRLDTEELKRQGFQETTDGKLRISDTILLMKNLD